MTVEPNALDFNADHPPTVVLRISRADATRIVRALDETSLSIGVAPGGSRLATSYRRLAADVRAQTEI